MSDHVYLKPNVIVEPLFNQWYAWSHLISPATAAMYVAHSHLKILESFIAAPQVHVSTLKNPAMLGGPFINYDVSKVGEIQALLDKTKHEQSDLLILAQAIQDLEQMLREEATGYSLESLYAKVPEVLKGYVELVYDANHHPSFRLLEGLFYQSLYYKRTSQSIALSLGDVDTRSFVLSTPRLPNVQNLHISLPFCDRHFDQLFKMREQAESYAQIEQAFAIQDKSLFGSFFTKVPPQKEPQYKGDDVKIRYFGHACILIETKSVSILCDPLISYEQYNGLPRYTYANLPETIDYALITHNHQDHVMLETLLQLRYKIKQVIVPKSNKGSLIDPSLKLILQQVGFSDVREIDELESITIPEGQIIGLPFFGEHGDLNIGAKTAYLIQLQGKSILCAADSNNIEPKLYDHLHRLFGNINILFIGMECEGAPYTWAYGALLSEPVPRKMAQTRRLDGSNAEKAIQLVNQLQPQQVYVYAMGQEPWLSFITSIQYTADSKAIVESNKLVEYCRSQNKISERLFGRKEIILNQSLQAMQNIEFEKPLTQFLSELGQLDIKLWVEGDKLRCNAPKNKLTSVLKTEIQKRKDEIIQFLDNQASPTITKEHLQADAILDPRIIPPSSTKSITKPANILLTGATGFLGTFLLSQLLEQTSASIYCLVRAETVELGRQKLQSRLESYLVWHESLSHRIIPIIGDLSQPLLGLSKEQFQKLSEKIDLIYHNGAWVHHASPYSLLKATNVLGTQEILRLACQTQVKPVHFISTVSVFPPDANTKVITETSSIEDQAPYGGYAQSKWVAEQLVILAKKRGLPVSIYRLGPISGHSQTGVFNVNDFLYRLMMGYIQLGNAPEGERMLDIIPVDYASKAIVYLSQKPESFNKAFHLIHPHPVSSDVLFEELCTWGYAIERIPYEQWYAKLLGIAQGFPEHALYPLVSLFSPETLEETTEKSLTLKFDCQNTEKSLTDSTINCPLIERPLFNTYLSYLIRSGFLDAPALQE